MTVTLDDIATTLLLSPTPAEDSLIGKAWTMWIADAQRQIRSRLGDLDNLDQDNLDYVVREAVAAKARQPDGVTQVSMTVDDGSVSKTYSRSTGLVTITDDWWALLSPTKLDDRGAFTINTVKGMGRDQYGRPRYPGGYPC